MLGLEVALVLPPHCRRLILTICAECGERPFAELEISQAAFWRTPILLGSFLSLRARASMTSLCMRRKLA